MKGDRLMLYPDDVTARKLLLTGSGKSPRGNRALHCFSLLIQKATDENAANFGGPEWYLLADALSGLRADGENIFTSGTLVKYLKEVLAEEPPDLLMEVLGDLSPINVMALLMSCSFFHDHANEIGRDSSDPWWTMDYRLAFLGREPTHHRPETASQPAQPG